MDEKYINDHITWSRDTFGRGTKIEGLLQHIRDELEEISETPTDAFEWADVIILALDGMWRNTDLSAEGIIEVLKEKQRINQERSWNRVEEGKPTKHIE